MKTRDFHNDVLPLKDRIFRLALRITLDRQEAEDITQETLMRAWERRDEWHQIVNMEAWCLTIAQRMALDRMKGQGARSRGQVELSDCENAQLPTPEASPDELLDRRQRVEAVRKLIDQLPETQRLIIALRDIEGMRYDEIAQVTGLTDTQVRVYLHRARTKIKQALTLRTL